MGLDNFKTDNTKSSTVNDTVESDKLENEEVANVDESIAKDNSYQPTGWLGDKFKEIGLDNLSRCNSCGEVFSRISLHYNMSGCQYPDIIEQDEDLLVGMQMSDGYLFNENTPYLGWRMTNLPFMVWFKDILNIETTKIRINLSAKRSHDKRGAYDDRERFNNNTHWTNTSDLYKCRTISHPSLSMLDWYTDSQKRFPDSIELNERVIKIWYCGDGSLKKYKDRKSIKVRLGVLNESDRVGMIKSLFKKYGLSLDNIYQYEYGDERGDGLRVSFSDKKSRSLLDKIGPAVPGFEYKWCTGSYEQYKKLKQLSTRTSATDEEAEQKLEEFDLAEHKNKALEIGGFGGYK